MRKEYNKKINIYGSSKEIEAAEKALNTLKPEILEKPEKELRLEIQKLIKNYKLKASILLNGNIVWDKDKILKNIRTIIRHDDMSKMSNYLYEFLHMECGSIAHYNKQGWIDTYPTVEALKQFFMKNEFGESVLKYQPHWATDRIEIIKEIEKLLKISPNQTKKFQYNL